MPITRIELEARLRAAFPDARVVVVDETGQGDHYAATIVAAAFAGVPPIARHRMVYAALGDSMRADIHALRLQTRAPDEERSTR